MINVLFVDHSLVVKAQWVGTDGGLGPRSPPRALLEVYLVRTFPDLVDNPVHCLVQCRSAVEDELHVRPVDRGSAAVVRIVHFIDGKFVIGQPWVAAPESCAGRQILVDLGILLLQLVPDGRCLKGPGQPLYLLDPCFDFGTGGRVVPHPGGDIVWWRLAHLHRVVASIRSGSAVGFPRVPDPTCSGIFDIDALLAPDR